MHVWFYFLTIAHSVAFGAFLSRWLTSYRAFRKERREVEAELCGFIPLFRKEPVVVRMPCRSDNEWNHECDDIRVP